MKSMVFDAGPVISLAMNNLLWILEPLKKKFNGRFCITEGVRAELVDRPIETKKFKFEAIQVGKLIEKGVLEVIDSSFIKSESPKLVETANKIFEAYKNDMKVIHYAEMSVIAAAIEMKADAVVVDEKTTRHLVENPKKMLQILRKSLRTSVRVSESNLKEFKLKVKDIKVIRSVELVMIAYEDGLLDEFILKIPEARKNLLQGVLWGVKLNGCAVSQEEIDHLVRLETR
jgi:hypothetical protein